MKKTIKTEEITTKIVELVNNAMEFYDDGNMDLYNHCYHKAIHYTDLLKDLGITYKIGSDKWEDEWNKIDMWFNAITHDAIYNK